MLLAKIFDLFLVYVNVQNFPFSGPNATQINRHDSKGCSAYLLQVVEVEYFVVELLFLALGQIISEHETADVVVRDPFGGVSHDVGEESVHLLLELTLNTSLQSRKKNSGP